MTWWWSNRPFPGSPRPLYQNEVRCSAFDMRMIFYFHANKTHFHKKGCALGLILKVKVFGTRKGPICFSLFCAIVRETSTEMEVKNIIVKNKSTSIFHALYSYRPWKWRQYVQNFNILNSETWILNILTSFLWPIRITDWKLLSIC